MVDDRPLSIAAVGDIQRLDSGPIYAALLRDAGIDLVTLANKHVLDYGPEGLADTLLNLKAAGIEALGAGLDLKTTARPLVIERNGVRLGFLATCLPSTKLLAALAEYSGKLKVTLYLLAHALHVKVKFSRSKLKWMLFIPRNNSKPMSYVDPINGEP